MSDLYTADRGMVALGPELVRVMELLEERFLGWADECGAVRMIFPPVISTADLASIDYFDNFPHLALMTAPLALSPDAAPERPTVPTEPIVPADGAVPADRLGASEYALASAACYHVYLHHRAHRLGGPLRVTTVARCFRNEDHYDGLRRLRGFTMREIVCVGSREEVRDHLARFRPKVLEYAGRLGLDLAVQPASDPFFEQGGGRAVLAQLFPVKEEFVHGGSLAIGSLNFHRNFFGERCDISLADGTPAFTACVAFGLERWLGALLERHPSLDDILARVTEAAV
ncbi:aminoacyl--tRNA ligase-related protein [Streptomyces sp. NPDC048290]|uniref:aminoacyl--tRNA ligase-related protein n=1 Tax=Streptomyces sp. NPDC048290 TaxID=3155811 RepID=UPI003416C477